MSKVLILGGGGMLGHKLFQRLGDRHDVHATFRGEGGPGPRLPVYADAPPLRLIEGVDALDFDSVVRALARVRPDVVINGIGLIKQVRAAGDPLAGIALNALFPHRLATLCAASGARLIHMSTDCVFSGRKGDYSEADVADAEDLYGRTKLLGEVEGPGCLTIRTSVIGRDFLKDAGLVEWFLGRRGQRVAGYRNAVFSGFPTLAFARIVGAIIADHPDLSGVLHVASAPISKYALLRRVARAFGLDVEIDPCDEPRCDRSLSAARFVAQTGYRIPDWDSMIEEMAADGTPYEEWRRAHAVA